MRCALQVHPAEVKEGVLSLNTSFTYDAQVAAFCTLQSQIGRRAPALVALKWSDVCFVKQAALLPDGSGLHAFGAVLKLRAEKVIDTHNSTLIVLDVSGDTHLADEALLTPSMQLLNLAVGMGAVDRKALLTTGVGEELPILPQAYEW